MLTLIAPVSIRLTSHFRQFFPIGSCVVTLLESGRWRGDAGTERGVLDRGNSWGTSPHCCHLSKDKGLLAETGKWDQVNSETGLMMSDTSLHGLRGMGGGDGGIPAPASSYDRAAAEGCEQTAQCAAADSILTDNMLSIKAAVSGKCVTDRRLPVQTAGSGSILADSTLPVQTAGSSSILTESTLPVQTAGSGSILTDCMLPVRVSGPPPASVQQRKNREPVLPQNLLQQVTALVKTGIVTDINSKQNQCPVNVPSNENTGRSEEKGLNSGPQMSTSVECVLSTGSEEPGTAGEQFVCGHDSVHRTVTTGSQVSTEQTRSVDNTWKTQEALPGDMMASTEEDSAINECSETYTMDVSVLFSEAFDKAYKKYERKARKEAKKAAKKAGKKRGKVVEIDVVDDMAAKRPRRPAPNYFIAIQIINPTIHAKLQQVQDCVVERKACLAQALVPLPTLHITLMVMHLVGEEDIRRACAALDTCQEKLEHLKSSPIQVEVSSIGHFGHQVVFARVREGPGLESLKAVAGTVIQCFKDHGVYPCDDKEFKPHITIMKLSRAGKLKAKGLRRIDEELYGEFRDVEFGKQTLRGLQLCSMLKGKDAGGYYHVEHQISLVPDNWQPPPEEQGTAHSFLSSKGSASPTSQTNRNIAAGALQMVLQELEQEDQKENEENEQDMVTSSLGGKARPVFTVELERELHWMYEEPSLHVSRHTSHVNLAHKQHQGAVLRNGTDCKPDTPMYKSDLQDMGEVHTLEETEESMLAGDGRGGMVGAEGTVGQGEYSREHVTTVDTKVSTTKRSWHSPKRKGVTDNKRQRLRKGYKDDV